MAYAAGLGTVGRATVGLQIPPPAPAPPAPPAPPPTRPSRQVPRPNHNDGASLLPGQQRWSIVVVRSAGNRAVVARRHAPRTSHASQPPVLAPGAGSTAVVPPRHGSRGFSGR